MISFRALALGLVLAITAVIGSAAADKIEISTYVYENYQEYLKKVEGFQVAVFAVAETGLDSYYIYCGNNCLMSSLGKEAVEECERRSKSPCRIMAVNHDLRIEFEVARQRKPASGDPILSHRLGPKQLRGIVGSKLHGEYLNGIQWTEYYDPSGEIRGHDGVQGDYTSRYALKGDQVCFDNAGNNDDWCAQVSVVGGQVYFLVDGELITFIRNVSVVAGDFGNIPADSGTESPPPQTAAITPDDPAPAAKQPGQAPQSKIPGLVAIPDDAKPVASGTAFFIAEKGRLLTNFHVVKGCQWIGLMADDKLHPAVTLAKDAELDLAILKTDFDGGGVATFADQQPEIGEDSYVAGYPLLDKLWSLNFTNGIVSSLSPGGQANLLQTTAPVQHGNSGGPMFDGSGRVVGVVVARLADETAENVNFAIKGEVATGFIRQAGLTPKISPRGKDLTARAIAKSARAMVVPAICFN